MGTVKIAKTVKTTKMVKHSQDVNAHISNQKMYVTLLILPVSMLILAFLSETPREIIQGLNDIRIVKDVLLTDYLLVGGLGSALVNSAILMLINIFLLYRLKLRPNGAIISSLFLIGGFAFIGKNIFNVWPFYFGGYLYSKYHKIPYKNLVIINMLSTTLSPLCSVLASGFYTDGIASLIIALVSGSFIGFIMPTISAHVLTAHSGYTLHNMGFAGGLVGMLIYTFLDSFGHKISTNDLIYRGSTLVPMCYLITFQIVLIVIGYVLNNKSFKGFKKVFEYPGKLVTDTTKKVGFALTLVNMGVSGLIAVVYVILLRAHFNGPVIAAILTVMGFSAFGKNLKNCIPILIGVALASFLVQKPLSVTTIAMTGLFGTTLAPIVGQYGPVYGIVLGMLHLVLATNIIVMHGGIHLYNNGLAAGIIATIFIPLIDAFRREKNQ